MIVFNLYSRGIMIWKKWFIGCVIGSVLMSTTAWAEDRPEGRVVVVEVSGAINPVVAEFVSTEIKDANAAQDELIIIRMDTPGGLDTSMRQIITPAHANNPGPNR